MNIKVIKTEKDFSLEINEENFNTVIKNLSKDNLIELSQQIEVVTKDNKHYKRVWNPRSNRHELVEE